MSEALEKEIQAKGLNAPRLNPKMIEDAIIAETYIVPGQTPGIQFRSKGGSELNKLIQESAGLLTICVLVLKNGFTVVGKSAPVSAANFDLEIGRKVAREDAVRQVWALEGYALRNRIMLVD